MKTFGKFSTNTTINDIFDKVVGNHRQSDYLHNRLYRMVMRKLLSIRGKFLWIQDVKFLHVLECLFFIPYNSICWVGLIGAKCLQHLEVLVVYPRRYIWIFFSRRAQAIKRFYDSVHAHHWIIMDYIQRVKQTIFFL